MVSDQSHKALIASVGAGRMGRGIAITFALAGHTARLIDVKERSSSEFEILQQSGFSELQSTVNMLCNIGMLDRQDIDSTIARISYVSKHECVAALHDADIIFEAVPETLAAKEAALKLISQFACSTAIVASTTSTILSDQLQPFMTNPERFLNAHWLNPAFLIPLVEVSPASKTEPAVVNRLNELLEKMGKVPVVCSASPGYIVPRIQALAMNEAARMVEEGVASVEDIDKATKYGFGFRFAILGLLEFIDWGGGDILYYASRYMTEAMDNQRYASPEIIERNMHEGRIGLSTQKGFLDYQSMNISDYQQERLAQFVSMLRHIGKLPASARQSTPEPANIEYNSNATDMVTQFLESIDKHEVNTAHALVTNDFSAACPGDKQLASLQQLAQWLKIRYQSTEHTVERFDQCATEQDIVIYCSGTLNGVTIDGIRFTNVRFINRFIMIDKNIQSLHMWNDSQYE